MYGKTKIDGMHCAVLRRSSSKGQGTSIANQGRTVDSVIAEFKLRVIREFILPGVTGSIPGNRSDIDDVITERKKLGNVPLLLLVPDHTRFTRAGAGHGGHLLYKLRTNGVLVYFVAEDLLVESDLTLQLALMLLAAAHQAAKSIARSSTIGSDISFVKGNSPYTRRPPLGMDRMYFLDGKPLHIIRNMPDGTQQMLHPETHELIRCFDKNPKNGVPAHYIKQKNETVALCPGAPEAIAKLFLLFEMHHVNRLKYRPIARQLNDDKIKSPMDMEWTSASVRAILLNPIYTGLAVRYRTTRGIYVQGGNKNGEPEPSDVTPEELDRNAKVKLRRRERAKWQEKAEDQFKTFLPDSFRDAAQAAALNHLDRIADGKPLQEINRDPHTQSLYILKNKLRCKKTLLPMKGRLSGKKGKQVRKYGISKGAHIPRSDGPSSKLVRAEPIESSVMALVREAVLNRPQMEAAMAKVLARAERDRGSEDDVAKMQKQVKRLRKQIALLSDQIDDEEAEDRGDPIVQKVEQVKQEIERLNVAIRQAGATPTIKSHDPREAIKTLADELEQFGRKINPADVPLICAVIDLLVSRLDVDRDTKEFEMELAVPSWLGDCLRHPLPAGLEQVIACKPQIEAHPENREILGVFRCHLERKPKCYGCRRAA